MVDITAVIPCYNAAPFIETALDSIAAQSHPVREIIIVDDGSKDDSASRIEDWRRRHPDLPLTFLRQKNQGVAVARNVGWNAAASPWIAFLDADDIWYPDHNARLIETLRHEDSPLVFCDADRAVLDGGRERPLPTFLEMAGLSGIIDRHAGTHQVGDPVHHRLLTASFIPTCSNLVRKTALEAIGGFEVGRAFGEDRQAWLKLFAQGPVSAARHSIGRQLYHDNNATHARHAPKELKGRLALLEDIRAHPGLYKLGKPELAIINDCLAETLDDLKYTLSRSGLRNMMSESGILKKHGAGFSLKDVLRGLCSSLFPNREPVPDSSPSH